MQKRLYDNLNALIESNQLSEYIENNVEEINAIESKLRYHKRNRSRERSMNSPVTRAALSRAASRPTNQRRMKQGFQRWLKLKGRKHLQKTASKRFESSECYEWEDVKLTIEKNLIDADRLISRFEDIKFESLFDLISKIKFLYNNYPLKFMKLFTKECEESGVVVDRMEEDTTTADIATTDGGFLSGNRSPWKIDNPDELFWYPMLIHELQIALNQMCYDESDEEVREAIIISMGDLDLESFEKEDLDRLENFLDYLDREFKFSKLTLEELEELY